MTTYIVSKMRAVFPSDKMRDKHPERFVTILGTFHNSDGAQLSFTSKAISNDEATHPEFAIDLVNGTLTLPDGERGRKATPSISQDDLNSALNSLRKPVK